MYNVGDRVYVISLREIGYVLWVMGDGTYQIDLDSMQTVRVHANDLRPMQ